MDLHRRAFWFEQSARLKGTSRIEQRNLSLLKRKELILRASSPFFNYYAVHVGLM